MIRAFIFDLDGTLYQRNSSLYLAMSSSVTRWFKTHLSVDGDFEIFYEKMKRDYPSPLEAIQAFGFSVASYHQEVFEEIDSKHYLLEDAGVKRTLSSLRSKKFLVTLSSRSHVERVFRALGVGQYFSGIYTPGVNWHTCHKIDAYESIRKECDLLPQEICVIGDNYAVDLEAAKTAGYSCILVSEEQHSVVPTVRALRQLHHVRHLKQPTKKGR